MESDTMNTDLFSYERPDGTIIFRDKWRKKFKGSYRGGAWIFVHPDLKYAIVSNHNGISYNGQMFASISLAKEFAEKDLKDG